MEELEHIIQHSSLVHFLLSEDWKDHFDRDDIREGEELLNAHRIQGYEIFSFRNKYSCNFFGITKTNICKFKA